MKVNIKKTKAMKVSRKGEGEINVTIDEETLEPVDRFRYLGVPITSDGRCETEIKTRIGMAKNAFNQRKELLRKSLNKDIKKRIIKAIMWSVVLYAAETWTYIHSFKNLYGAPSRNLLRGAPGKKIQEIR